MIAIASKRLCSVIILVIFVFQVCAAFSAYAWSFDDDVTSEETKVLVFGGNGFLGSTVVTSLLEQGLTNITVVNRGGRYWDSTDRIFEKVASVECDREQGLANCKQFTDDVKNRKFEFVLDFSVADGKMMNETLELLEGQVG